GGPDVLSKHLTQLVQLSCRAPKEARLLRRRQVPDKVELARASSATNGAINTFNVSFCRAASPSPGSSAAPELLSNNPTDKCRAQTVTVFSAGRAPDHETEVTGRSVRGSVTRPRRRRTSA